MKALAYVIDDKITYAKVVNLPTSCIKQKTTLFIQTKKEGLTRIFKRREHAKKREQTAYKYSALPVVS